MSDALKTLSYLAAAFDLESKMIEEGALVGRESESTCEVKHSFGDGCYVREWNSPPFMLVVSKVHKVAHPYFVLRGEISVMTEDGVERIKAPHYGITPAGTKRVLYTHSETQWITVHVTDSTDVDEIEKEIICSDMNELQLVNGKLKEVSA